MRTATGSGILLRVFPFLIVAAVLALAALAGQPELASFRAPLLALGVGAVGLVLLLGQPGLGLAALAALSFTVPFTLGTGSEVALTPPVLLIPVVVAAWLLSRMQAGALRLPQSRTILPLLLFLLSGLLSLLAGRAYWDPLVPQPGNLLLVQLAQWGLFALSAAIFLVTGDLAAEGRWLKITTFAFLAVGSVVVLEFYLPPLRRLLGWSDPTMANRSLVLEPGWRPWLAGSWSSTGDCARPCGWGCWPSSWPRPTPYGSN